MIFGVPKKATFLAGRFQVRWLHLKVEGPKMCFTYKIWWRFGPKKSRKYWNWLKIWMNIVLLASRLGNRKTFLFRMVCALMFLVTYAFVVHTANDFRKLFALKCFSYIINLLRLIGARFIQLDICSGVFILFFNFHKKSIECRLKRPREYNVNFLQPSPDVCASMCKLCSRFRTDHSQMCRTFFNFRPTTTNKDKSDYICIEKQR